MQSRTEIPSPKAKELKWFLLEQTKAVNTRSQESSSVLLATKKKKKFICEQMEHALNPGQVIIGIFHQNKTESETDNI